MKFQSKSAKRLEWVEKQVANLSGRIDNLKTSVAAKISEISEPTYEWQQTAERISIRVAALEREQTIIRDRHDQIEQALKVFGIQLQKKGG